MRASYMAVCLFLALFLVGCGGGESETGSAESSSAATRPVLELTTADEEESTGVASEPAALATGCEPTQPDMLGPYYMPDAPVRTSVDTGYMMSGRVLSADGCEPIPGAQLEFWLADSQGVYDDAHRATVLAGEGGEYRFQGPTRTDRPTSTSG